MAAILISAGAGVHPTPARDLLPHSVSSTVYCLRVSLLLGCGWSRPVTGAVQLNSDNRDTSHCTVAMLRPIQKADPQYHPTFLRISSWSQIEPTLSSNHKSIYFWKNSWLNLVSRCIPDQSLTVSNEGYVSKYLAENPTVHCGLCVGGSNVLPIRREAAAVLGWAGMGWLG